MKVSSRVPGPALAVTDLGVAIDDRGRDVTVLRGVSVAVRQGQMVGLVGETGSGKTMTARAVAGALPYGGRITSGSIELFGRQLIGLEEKEYRGLRGPVFSMIVQNPGAALYPMLRVGAQIGNVVKAHLGFSRRQRTAHVLECLALAGFPDPRTVARAYPHELSGGMAQRAVIATALSCRPQLVIADEPTTGLDATIQRQILDLLAELQQRLDLSVLIITHDLGIVAQYCDSVVVMRDGLIVEDGPKHRILKSPQETYTRQLIKASELDDLRTDPSNGTVG